MFVKTDELLHPLLGGKRLSSCCVTQSPANSFEHIKYLNAHQSVKVLTKYLQVEYVFVIE